MPLIDLILTFKRPSDPFCLFSLFCPLNSPTLPLSVFMTPNHYSSSFSPFLIDLNEDQNQQLFNYHHAAPEVASSSSSSQPYLNITNLTPEGGPCYHTESESLALPHEKEANLCTSYDHTSSPPKNENHNVLRLSVSKKEGKQENKSNNISVKWTPSKMRLMKKMMMMSSDQASTNIPERSTQKVEDHEERSSTRSSQDSPNNNSTSNTVRVCSDCNTTKTPLWRSGPRGPKSLCNACGIRQRKARRAAMAAAAGEGGGANNSTLFAANSTPTMKNKAQYKERKIKNSHLPFKKRCKFTAARGGSISKKLCFEDLTVILNNNSSAFQRVFPQDEKEAAILLMALSYGLVHG